MFELSMAAAMKNHIDAQAAQIKALERLIADVHNCLLEKMPSVALQTIQLSGLDRR